MRVWPHLSVPTLPTWSGHLATLLMLALLAWLCANIWWDWRTPTPQAAVIELDTDPSALAAEIARRNLFGQAAPVISANAPASAAPAHLQLTGIIAAQHDTQAAYALLAYAGQPARVVRQGEEISPGLVVQRISPQEVELSHQGQRQSLTLPKPGTTR